MGSENSKTQAEASRSQGHRYRSSPSSSPTRGYADSHRVNNRYRYEKNSKRNSINQSASGTSSSSSSSSAPASAKDDKNKSIPLARHAGPQGSPSSSTSSSSSAPSKDDKNSRKEVKSSSSALVVSSAQQNLYKDFEETSSVMWEDKHHDIKKIIWDYSFDPQWIMAPFGFFRSSLEQEILALAYHAAPLEDVERYVRQAHARNETHLPKTLVQATVQAISNLDVTITIRDENGVEIVEGMAERLMMGLYKELYPETFLQSLQTVRARIPVESKENQDAREASNVARVNNLFDAIKQNDQNTEREIKNFGDFVKSTTQLNRLHLLSVAVNVLGSRGGELTGTWYGALGDRICFDVIGLKIERDFSPRMRQILPIRVYDIFNRHKAAVQRLRARELDIDGKAFMGAGRQRTLGVDSYYDACGLGEGARIEGSWWCGPGGPWEGGPYKPAARCDFENLVRAMTLGMQQLDRHLETEILTLSNHPVKTHS